MKTDKTKVVSDAKNKGDDITVVIKSEGKLQTPFLVTVLPVISVLVAILPDMIKNLIDTSTAKVGILTILLSSIVTFYIRMNADSILNRKLSKEIIILSYLGSLCLLVMVPEPEIYSFWMLGGLVTAMLVDQKLGLIFHFNLSFILGISMSIRPEAIIGILIIGVLMNMLAGALKTKSTIIYAAIIVLSSNVTLAFVINNFIFETKMNFNYLSSLFSNMAVLVIAFFVCLIYEKVFGDNVDTVDQINSEPDPVTKLSEPAPMNSNSIAAEIRTQELSTISESKEDNTIESCEIEVLEEETTDIKPSNANVGTRTSYDVLCDLENELIIKMKEFSESLYQHSVYISDLSFRAAKEIGANELLVRAGGLYHEIGKIHGKNYIEEGLKIAEDYAFPNELKAILKEHNIKYEKPNSVEAAIVMLSDNVVSTIDYIEKTEDNRYTTDKIIDNIFLMRMDKGTFDGASLSLTDFKKLKEFYQKEYKNNKSEKNTKET